MAVFGAIFRSGTWRAESGQKLSRRRLYALIGVSLDPIRRLNRTSRQVGIVPTEVPDGCLQYRLFRAHVIKQPREDRNVGLVLDQRTKMIGVK